MRYFDHDTTAASDCKVMELRIAEGGAAVDAYWYVLEQLYRDEQPLQVDEMTLRVHAHALCTDPSTVEGWLDAMVDAGLLYRTEDGSLWADRVDATVASYQAKRAKAKTAADARWSASAKQAQTDSDANAMRTQCDRNADAMRTQCDRNADAMRTQCERNATAMPIEEKRIEEKRGEEKRAKFIPPTLSEVTDYVNEKGYSVSPEAFMAYYESNGWKVGRNSMKSWQAACTSWEKRGKGREVEGDGRFTAYDV